MRNGQLSWICPTDEERVHVQMCLLFPQLFLWSQQLSSYHVALVLGSLSLKDKVCKQWFKVWSKSSGVLTEHAFMIYVGQQGVRKTDTNSSEHYCSCISDGGTALIIIFRFPTLMEWILK